METSLTQVVDTLEIALENNTKKLEHFAPLIMTAWTNNKSKTWTDAESNVREFVNNYHENITQTISPI